MNSNTLPISQVRAQLPDLVNQASDLSRRTYITVQGKIKAVLMNFEDVDELEATEEIIRDPEAVKAIQEGLDDVKHGRLIPWEEVKKQLNW